MHNISRRKFVLGGCTAAAMGAMALAGCSSSGESAAPAEGEKTELLFWCHENEPWFKSYEAIAQKFMDANPQYSVKVESYPFGVYNEKIQTALTTDEGGADICAVWGGKAPAFIETDNLSPVPDDLVKELESDYMEPTLGIYKKEGTYYGVPMEYNLEYGGLIVNKTLFDEAGKEYPKTWEELRKLSGEVCKKEGDVVTMGGIEMIDGDALFCNFLAMILQQGGEYIVDDGSINLATPQAEKAMEEMVSMVKNGECSLEHLAADDYCFADVYQDKAFGCSVGTWGIGEGESFGKTYGVDYEYVATPQYGDTMAFASETGWGIIVPGNGKNVDAAWEFVKFFSQPENLVEHNIACSQLPPRESLLTNETYLKEKSDIDFILDILPYGIWMGPYNTSDLRTIFNQAFMDLCEADDPDYAGKLAEISEQMSAECKLSYSRD